MRAQPLGILHAYFEVARSGASYKVQISVFLYLVCVVVFDFVRCLILKDLRSKILYVMGFVRYIDIDS